MISKSKAFVNNETIIYLIYLIFQSDIINEEDSINLKITDPNDFEEIPKTEYQVSVLVLLYFLCIINLSFNKLKRV